MVRDTRAADLLLVVLLDSRSVIEHSVQTKEGDTGQKWPDIGYGASISS